jgi:hypothetical protein
MLRRSVIVALLWCGPGSSVLAQTTPGTPIPIRRVVVMMFEVGNDTGDTPLIAAYRVGSRVAGELADHWDKYADRLPGGGP